MNILVIGNGFDIAHHLQTSYMEFLEFVESFHSIWNTPHIMQSGGLACIEKPKWRYIDNLIWVNKEFADEFWNMTKDNFWIKYFSKKAGKIGVKWIDFESEISRLVRLIENDVKEYDKALYYISDDDAMGTFKEVAQGIEKYTDLFERMLVDLRKLIRSFEIYVSVYINSEEIKVRIPEIEEIDADKVLSFNYTNTYERLYATEKSVEICYVHGKADRDNRYGKDTTNIVLGIDEYLPDDEKNVKIEHIGFKKYYQRIIKGTGNRYLSWIDDIRIAWDKRNAPKTQLLNFSTGKMIVKKHSVNVYSNLYIFGHSLGKTDGDIFEKLICNDNVKTTIFYHDNESLKEQVINLVQIIGQDELIKRTGGQTQTIWFKKQK